MELQFHPDPAAAVLLLLLLESCLQNCMTRTIAECTVNNT
jgi:hypothetical protein